jgi:CBS domain containing-hemolysin-like protein
MADAARAGEIEAEDVDLVERSFDFGDMRVRDVYVPRPDVVAADVSMPVAEALELAIEHGHRRLLVSAGGLDDLVGVVRLRDLAAAVGSADSPDIASLVAEPLRVSTADRVAAVLRRMQSSGRRFAVVTGRGGATEGIVTVEDIVAELVGEIEEDD